MLNQEKLSFAGIDRSSIQVLILDDDHQLVF